MQYEQKLVQPLMTCTQAWNRRSRSGRLPRCFQQFRQTVQVLGSEGAVHEREACEDVYLRRLRQAAGDQHHARGIIALEPRRRPQVAGEAVVGALAHGAGVVHEHAGVVWLVRGLQAVCLEQRADALGVVLVHLASERAEIVAAMHGDRVP
jgi:hypothetical protein